VTDVVLDVAGMAWFERLLLQLGPEAQRRAPAELTDLAARSGPEGLAFVSERHRIDIKEVKTRPDRGRSMLGIHRLTSKGADYYLSDLAHELPLPRPGRRGQALWSGRAAEGLGLRGPIDPEHLRAVLDGRHPTSGPGCARTGPPSSGST
jgi:hypothetical protein